MGKLLAGLPLSCYLIVCKNGANLPVALNWGTGSSSLNADVKAFDRLHIVRGWNSSTVGLKYSSWTFLSRCFGASSSPSVKAR